MLWSVCFFYLTCIETLYKCIQTIILLKCCTTLQIMNLDHIQSSHICIINCLIFVLLEHCFWGKSTNHYTYRKHINNWLSDIRVVQSPHRRRTKSATDCFIMRSLQNYPLRAEMTRQMWHCKIKIEKVYARSLRVRTKRSDEQSGNGKSKSLSP